MGIFKSKKIKSATVSRWENGIFAINATTNSNENKVVLIDQEERREFIRLLASSEEVVVIHELKFPKKVREDILNKLSSFVHFADVVNPHQIYKDELFKVLLVEDSIIFKRIESTEKVNNEYEFQMDDLNNVIETLGQCINFCYTPQEDDKLVLESTNAASEEVEHGFDELYTDYSKGVILKTVITVDRKASEFIMENQLEDKTEAVFDSDIETLSKILQSIRMYTDEINEEIQRGEV